jgi:DNA polymerase I-like protein with 3'-5' exonuclease and polymerase domains
LTKPWYLDVSRHPWTAYTDGSLPVLTLDLETTNLDHGDPRNPGNRIVDIALRVNNEPVSKEVIPVINAFSGSPAIFVAHNAKFELGWLNRLGVDTTQWLVWDTMLAEYVLAGNRRVPLDLDSVAKRRGLGGKGRLVDRMMKAGICPSEMPVDMLRERVVWDVDRTYALFRIQTEELARKGLMRVMFTRCIMTPVLAHMEGYGMLLDAERVNAEYEKTVAQRAELAARLNVIGNGCKLKGPQLADLVYNKLGFEELRGRNGEPIRTSTGRPSTSQVTLSSLVATTPEQKEFLEVYRAFNQTDAAISKTLAFFKGVVDEHEGRFVANFHQTRTQTHRLSSSGKRLTFKDGKDRTVQFQNFPRVFKPLFRAPPGYVLAEADGSQLEFRTGGSLARDPQVLEDVLTGADVHRYTASVIFRVPEDKVSKERRNEAKRFTFKPMYGGQTGTKREQEYYEAFKRKYHVMYDTQMGWVHHVLKHKQLRTASGLVFYWPDTAMKSSGYISNTPSIFNYPVQSLATAEIIPVSVVYTFWESRARGLDVRLVNTIHDSVVAEVAEKDLDKYRKVVTESFLKRVYEYLDNVYGIKMFVPLAVSHKAGKFWGDGEEVTVSYGFADTSQRA